MFWRRIIRNIKNFQSNELVVNNFKSKGLNLKQTVLLQRPGYSAEMKSESLDAYEYPNGSEWKKLFAEGVLYKHPDTEQN